MSFSSFLIDEITNSSLDSIYNHQVSGEIVAWYYEESLHSFSDYFNEVTSLISRVDDLIDLDFQYTSDYDEADLVIGVYAWDHPKNDAEDPSNGFFTNYTSWGEVDVFIEEYTRQSDINSAVHELGHYLGLGEPGFDERYDQLDTAMSYNPSYDLPGEFQTYFTGDDIETLLYLHGAEDDQPLQAPSTIPEQPIAPNNGIVDPDVIDRLYTAAFGRMPDDAGRQFWVEVVGDPLVTLKDVSKSFIDSQEFSSIALPGSPNEVFAEALYQNVLGREPDSLGLGYWVGLLDSGMQDRAEVLIGFADSPENIALHDALA